MQGFVAPPLASQQKRDRTAVELRGANVEVLEFVAAAWIIAEGERARAWAAGVRSRLMYFFPRYLLLITRSKSI